LQAKTPNSATTSGGDGQSDDCVRRCQTVCNGSDAHTFHVNGENDRTSSDVRDDDAQYVALDCEFVGVGPRQLSALGTFALNNFELNNNNNNNNTVYEVRFTTSLLQVAEQ